jgi:hypothetical protein
MAASSDNANSKMAASSDTTNFKMAASNEHQQIQDGYQHSL